MERSQNDGATALSKADRSWLEQATPEDMEYLSKEAGPGFADSVLQQTRAPLSTLCVSPQTFQPRDPNEDLSGKQEHIWTLAGAAKTGLLDPILVFPVQGMRVVIDGHCRLAAYREAGRKGSLKVPVRYFRGTFSEALLEAGARNSKDKLRLSTSEKAEQAWKLVLFDEDRREYSLRQIAMSSGVGKSTVGRMREILREAADAFDPREHPWKRVQELRQGQRKCDHAWETKLTDDWTQRLYKAFGPKPLKQPDVFRGAIEQAYPLLIDEWFRDEEEEEEDD